MKAIEERYAAAYIETEKPECCGACPFGETNYTNNTIRCTKAGLSAEGLAEKAGYKPETMQKYFNGVRQPKAFMLYRIAQATKRTMEWFMTDEHKPHGRLIDADKLASVVYEALEIGRRTQAETKSAVIAGYIRAMNNMLQEIENAETVVEAQE